MGHTEALFFVDDEEAEVGELDVFGEDSVSADDHVNFAGFEIGQNFLFSGEWWIVAFPSLTLAVLVLAVNLLGDWLRDALNPRLK